MSAMQKVEIFCKFFWIDCKYGGHFNCRHLLGQPNFSYLFQCWLRKSRILSLCPFFSFRQKCFKKFHCQESQNYGVLPKYTEILRSLRLLQCAFTKWKSLIFLFHYKRCSLQLLLFRYTCFLIFFNVDCVSQEFCLFVLFFHFAKNVSRSFVVKKVKIMGCYQNILSFPALRLLQYAFTKCTSLFLISS